MLTHIALGVVQGFTEFLPISSSGHLILMRELIGTTGVQDIALDALLHFATALAVLVYFKTYVAQLVRAAVQLPATVRRGLPLTSRDHMVIALGVGTIPAGVFGLLLEDIMATAFRNPLLVAGALVVGSGIMLAGEHITRFHACALTRSWWRKGLVVGLFQSLALIPGMSRSGMTISGGMLLGLSRRESAEFGFLLGVPVLLGAGAKKALELGALAVTPAVLAGTLAAFIVALLVIHYLLRYVRNHTLHVFIGYRVLLALVIIIAVSM